ncbi:MAG: HAMP domain-containing histidine kinase [Verrucomicrobia bacterium]|nr:HAMP domain-containing histidine kinase [Verrucomicrobiota bacterium]
MVSRQTARMKSMMQELIDFTQPGGEKPKLRPVQFASFLEALVEEVTAELAQRGVQLMVAEPVPRVTMRLDSQRLARLFYNLFSNAADEMETGGTISLSCRKTDGELQIDIQDTGPGIPPEFAASLFKPFATHGKPHGTGLGLTICRRIAEDHGGRIWATSTPGHGATFSFTLPLARR